MIATRDLFVAAALTVSLLTFGCEGKQGPTGPAGGQGEQGVEGPRGFSGPRGPKGESGDVSVVTILVNLPGGYDRDNQILIVDSRIKFAKLLPITVVGKVSGVDLRVPLWTLGQMTLEVSDESVFLIFVTDGLVALTDKSRWIVTYLSGIGMTDIRLELRVLQ
jgi:hypothetical protein